MVNPLNLQGLFSQNGRSESLIENLPPGISDRYSTASCFRAVDVNGMGFADLP